MDAVSHKVSLTPLPFRAAAFVALICGAILAMNGWREWTARAMVLKTAEVETSNLARSMLQHAEDSFDLLDASILGIALRLETQGAGPETLSNLQTSIFARKADLKRIRGLLISDETGRRIASSTGEAGPSVSNRQ